MKSQNIILTGKQKIEVVEKNVRDPAEGEVVGESLISLISTGTESICYRGEFDPGSHWERWVKYPFNIGYQNIARVIKVGPGVQRLKEGDLFFSTGGHHFQYFVVGAKDAIFKLPAGLPIEDAAWSSLATTTQTGVRRAKVKMGAMCVVIGLGLLGQLVVQYLRVSGAENILAIDPVQMRLDYAATKGATHTFRGSAADALPFVTEHSAGRLADVVFDVTGHWAVLPLALPLARQFGKVVLVGDSSHPSRQHLTPDVLRKQIDVLGSHTTQLPPEDAEWTAERQTYLYYTFVQRGLMRMADLITHRHNPLEAPAVYAKLLDNRTDTMGVLFDWAKLK
ncbi:MAG: zinc-binding dehydrogenase [Phycisphaerae bacterium]|jgi:2-desacetyl-2-hydroxyethyl bacteriochlorophyllide A dehydrogenase